MGWVESIKRRASALRSDTYALYLAYRDPRVPWYARAWTALVAAYAFSPIDLVPDFIPVLGYLDDIVLIPLGVGLAIKLIPAEVMAECRERAAGDMARSKRSMVGAVFIVGVWILVAGAIAWAIFSKRRLA